MKTSINELNYMNYQTISNIFFYSTRLDISDFLRTMAGVMPLENVIFLMKNTIYPPKIFVLLFLISRRHSCILQSTHKAKTIPLKLVLRDYQQKAQNRNNSVQFRNKPLFIMQTTVIRCRCIFVFTFFKFILYRNCQYKRGIFF